MKTLPPHLCGISIPAMGAIGSYLHSNIIRNISIPAMGGAIAQIDFAAFNSGISIPAMGGNRPKFRARKPKANINPRNGGQ